MKKKRKKGISRGWQASFTIEASFIIPVILIGIVGLVWCVFFLRNSVKSLADADYFMFVLEADAAKNKYEGAFADEFVGNENAYFGAKTTRAKLSREGRNIRVSVMIEHNLPEKGILGSILSGMRNISVEKDETIGNPSETARLIKAAGEIINSITGIGKDKKDKADE